MNDKLIKAMREKGDTQQDLANFLGLHSYISVHSKIYRKTGWKKEQIEKVCKRYKKTKEELGL